MSWFFKKKDKDKKDSEPKDNTGDISPRDEQTKSKPKALDPKKIDHLVQKLKAEWEHYIDAKTDKDRRSRLISVASLFIRLYDVKKLEFRQIKQGLIPTEFVAALVPRLTTELNANRSGLPRVLSSAPSPLAVALNHVIIEENDALRGILGVGALAEEITVALQSVLDLSTAASTSREKALELTAPSSAVDVLVNLLLSLCSHEDAMDEFVRFDALEHVLSLPFHALHSSPLLTAASLKLLLTSRDRLLSGVNTLFKYLHVDAVNHLVKKKWLATVLATLSAPDSMPAEHIVDMSSTIFKCLKESTRCSAALLDQFKELQGYAVTLKLLLHFDHAHIAKSVMKQFLDQVTDLVFVGTRVLSSKLSSPKLLVAPALTRNLSRRDSALLMTATREIKNIDAFKLFHDYFLKSAHDEFKLYALECVTQIYASHPNNFRIVEEFHLLSHLLQAAASSAPSVRDAIMNLLVFVVTSGLNCVAYQELVGLSCLLQEHPVVEVCRSVQHTVARLIAFDAQFADTMTDAGMLQVLITLMTRMDKQIKSLTAKNERKQMKLISSERPMTYDEMSLVLHTLALVLEHSPRNRELFRHSRSVVELFSLLNFAETRNGCLAVSAALIRDDNQNAEGETKALIEHFNQLHEVDARHHVLVALHTILCSTYCTKDWFRAYGGFKGIEVSLAQLQDKLANDKSREHGAMMQYLLAILQCTGAAIHNHQENMLYLREDVKYDTIERAIVQSGVLTSSDEHALTALDALITLACHGRAATEQNRMLEQPEVIALALRCAFKCTLHTRERFVETLTRLAQQSRVNCAVMSQAGVITMLLAQHGAALPAAVLTLIEILAKVCIAVTELAQLVRFMSFDDPSLSLTRALLRVCHTARSPSCISLSNAMEGWSCLELLITDRTWPVATSAGYTLMFWFCIESYASADNHLDALFRLIPEDKKNVICLSLKQGRPFLHTTSKEFVEVKSVVFTPGQWYHLALVHEKNRFVPSTSEIKFYVDGVHRATETLSYPPAVSNRFTVEFGTSKSNALGPSNQLWLLGPSYMIDGVVDARDVHLIAALGPSYHGNFQGPLDMYQTYSTINAKSLSLVNELAGGTRPATPLGHLDLSKARLAITEDRIVFMLSAFNVKYLMHNSEELSLSTEDLMEEDYVAWTARRERSEPNYQHWAVIRGPRRRALTSPQSLNNSRSSSAVTSPRASRMGSVINSITALGALGALEAGDVFANQLALALGGARLVPSMPVVSLFACVAGHRLLLHYLECVDHPQSGVASLSAEECSEHLNVLLAMLVELLSGPASSVNVLLFERAKVYPLLEYILSFKAYLFNSDTVMLLFDLLCCTRTTGPKYFASSGTASNKTDLNSATIANPLILRTVMMNYDVWRASRMEIRLKWLKHLTELLSGNFHKEFNLWRMRKSHALSALLYMLNDDTLDEALLPGVVDLISHLVHGAQGLDDLRALSVYLVATLPLSGPGAPVKPKLKTRSTTVRTMLLSIVLDVLMGQKCTDAHVKIFDPQWTFLFIDFNLDVTTVTLALKIACTLYVDSLHFATKFRAMHGFAVLQRILPSFSYCVDAYYIAFCFVYNRSLHALPAQPSDFLALFDLFKDAAPSQAKEMFNVVFAMLKKSFERSLSTERISSESELQLVNKRASMSRTSSEHHAIKPSGPASWKGGTGGSLLTQSLFVACGVVDMLSGRAHRVTVVSNNAVATKTNQKTLVLFLRHLFNTNKKDMFDMLMTRDDTLNDLVDMLFPTGALNLPQSTGSEDECASDQSVLESDQQIESGHLVFDLLSYIVTTALLDQNLLLLDRVVELAPPVNISDRDYVRYMSKILTDAIKHFLVTVHKADVLANKYELFSMLAKFASYVVDKIAMDLFPSGTAHVFDLLVHVLELFSVDKAPAIDPRFEVSSLFKSLNRTILLMLKSSDQLIDALNKLLYHQRVVLSPLNNDTEFFFSFSQLTYRMMLHDSDALKLTVMNIWKLLIFTKPEVMDSLLLYKTSKGEVIDLKTKGFMLLLSADPAEFLTWLNHNIKTVNVIFEELLNRTNTAPSSELKVRTEKLKALKARRSAKASKQQKSETSSMTKFQKVRVNRRAAIARTSEEENQRLKTVKNNRADRERWIAKIWNDMRRPMYLPNSSKDVSLNQVHHSDKPRGSEDEEIKLQELTQQITAKVLDKWQLDFTEGPRRMRRKLEANAQFFDSYPYSPDYDPDVNHHLASEQELILYPTKKPLSHDSKEYFYGYKDAVDKSLEYLHRVQEEMTKRRAAPPLALTLTAQPAPSTERDTLPATARSPEERRALAHVHEAFEGRSASDEPDTPPSSSPLSIKPLRKISSASGDSEDSDDTGTTPSSVPHSPALRGEVTPNTLAAYLQSLLIGEDVDSDESAVTDEQSELTEGSDEDWTSEADPNSELGEDELDQDVFGDDEDDEDANQLILRRHLELGDAAVAMYNCGRIEGLDKYDGLLIFGEINVYFIDHYSLTPEGDIVDISAQSKRATPFINYTSTWAHEDLKTVMKRRYLLRPVALELFANDGRNCLLVFELKDRDQLYDRFLALIKQVRDGQQQSLAAMIGLNNPAAATAELQEQDLSSTPLENLHLPLKTMTQKWVQGELSNFHYLIYLNTLAGRSYNDLTQYPVFPWVLNTYDTPTIDLHDPAVYRALDKPMGGLDSERADKFRQKYEVFEQTLAETASEAGPDDPEHMAPYHYGSHYSSSGTVLHYLIRLEPFTRQFIQFQGGRFDHPDRLFHSISESWQSASTKNMMDVKELIPEFFYLSDFLLNANRFIFGKRQDGSIVNNVVLPVWAKNSPRYFVHLHRRALESEHVSNQLHLWIDLIFGVKQRGPEAVSALNVFHPLTYEGTVDVDRIEDPIKRRAIIDQINHFGQTPAQLFTKPHPKRTVRTSDTRSLFEATTSPVAVNVKTLTQAVGEIRLGHDKLITLELKKRVLQAVNNSIKWVSWGYEDYTVRVWENDKLLQIIDRGAWDQIQHVATSIDGKYLALAGGRDCVLSIYRLRMRNLWRQSEETAEESSLTPTTKKKKRGLALGLTALKFIAQPQLLTHKDSFEWWSNLLGHQAPITAVDISRRWSIIASGDQHGKLYVWDLNKRFNAVVWQRDTSLGLHYQGDEPTSRGVNLIAINAITGDIVTCFSTWFNLWTINGDLILAHNTSNSPAQQITCVSWMPGPTHTDEIFAVVTGHRDGTIKVWKFNHLDKEQRPNPNMVMLAQLQQHRSAITSLWVSERRILSGDHVGQIYAWLTKEDAEEFVKKKKF